jgi:chromosome segregation ATPase
MSSSTQDQPPGVRLKQPSFNGDATIRASASPRREDPSPVDDDVPLNGPGQAWDSTIGKAGLGKTGRVINKLVSDNDSLKRDLKLEKLRADEARQSAKLLEDKMERMISDYESRLLEANVTKTLLARKERQVETLTASVGLEKSRADSALERERGWRDEMEKMRASTTRQVDDAAAHAALMEGRYNAIASHWKDQGDDVKKAHLKLRSEIAGLVAERRSDDEKITTLQDLCDQQDGNIRELRRQRDDMAAAFEEYKRQQEGLLAGIKEAAAQRELDQERMLAETREVLHKLKWALNVKENVKDAS